MPTVTLEISPDLENELQVRAVRQGRDIASVALELVETGLRRESRILTASERTPEQRLQGFLEWVKNRPKLDVVVDVSRESIYEGCGE
jgi:hypothetical protein